MFALLVLAATSILVGGAVLGWFLSQGGPVETTGGVHVFYNEACGACGVYVRDVLLPTLGEAGYEDVQLKDYLNDVRHRGELNSLNDAVDVPFGLRSHLATFVFDGQLLVLQGHIPRDLLLQALEFPGMEEGSPLLLYQDSVGEAATYKVWSSPRAVEELDISTPLATYFTTPSGPTGGGNDWPFASLVLMAGLLDGLNPCAIAILLFFISLLYAVRRPRNEILQMGLLYVYAIFLVYFLIGLGLMQAIVLSGETHLVAKVGAYLVIGLGLLTIGGLFVKPLGAVTRTPHVLWERTRSYLMRATLPSAFLGGFLVGLCTFPCSGGIYVAVLGLLSSRTDYWTGLGYLSLYNLMFVAPLVAILLGVRHRRVSRRLATWEAGHRVLVRLLAASVMIAIGVLILVFFV